MSPMHCDRATLRPATGSLALNSVVGGIAAGSRVPVRLKFKARFGTVVRSLTERGDRCSRCCSYPPNDGHPPAELDCLVAEAASYTKRGINLTRGSFAVACIGVTRRARFPPYFPANGSFPAA